MKSLLPLLLLLPLVQPLHLYAPPPYLSLYPNKATLDSLFASLSAQHPGRSRLDSCQQDPELQFIRVGPKTAATGIVMCNIHARELITAQICLEWVRRYLAGRADLAVAVFYVANRNRELVLRTGKCERKASSGVDLNRNFPTEFGFYNSTLGDEIYGGKQPISEPFTRCLDRILRQQQPLFFVDFHSGQNGGLFYQQGYNSRQDRLIFETVNQEICNKTCRITTLARDDEAINGHIFADVKVRLNMKYSFLVEAYGVDDGRKECLLTFNPGSEEEKKAVARKWAKGLDVLIREIRKREKI